MKSCLENLRYPLQWPVDKPRSRRSESGRFGDTTIARERNELQDELRRLGVNMSRDWVISSNLRLRRDGLPYSQQKTIEDTGIAVYFQWKGQPYCFACDRWKKIEHNLRAIVLHINAIRGVGRWGVGSMTQAFAGYKALTDGPVDDAGELQLRWWHVLKVDYNSPFDEVQSAYREMAKRHHPDRGGDPDLFKRVSRAWSEFKVAREAVNVE